MKNDSTPLGYCVHLVDADDILRYFGGGIMKIILTSLFLVSFTGASFAAALAAPEIDALSGMTALGLVGAVITLVWERRRKQPH